MRVLQQELHLVSELAPKGSHSRVAKAFKISGQYLWQIRKGKNMNTDTKENRKTLRDLITLYRKEISEYKKKLENIKNQ